MSDTNEQIETIINYFINSELWLNIGKTIIEVIAVIIIGFIAIRVGKRLITRIFTSRKHVTIRMSERREQTLRKLTESALIYTVYIIVFMTILQSFGVKIGALLAGAGVAGLAIGFGAQSLVKDVISGFFIIFEDQFAVGDYVNVSDAEGTVEEIGLRTTKIKSWTGERHVIPNGNISQVINYSIHDGVAVVDINIPYESNSLDVEKKVESIIQKLPSTYDFFKSVPVVYGVQTLDLSHYVIRVTAETLPVFQWKGARVIRKEVKEQLYNEGIEIPAPRLVMYSRKEADPFLKVKAEE